MRAQREAWAETLVELAKSDPRIVVLDGDLATSTRADLFAIAHPEKFFEIGIAEQNMVGMAFGLSTLGYRPWMSSFGVFFTHRALDPVRMLIAQTGAPVRIAASYAGLLNGRCGKTHQDIEDLAIMRAMPGMTVIAPADASETAAAVRWAADHDGPVYLRMARDAVGDVFPEQHVFVPGAVHVLRSGADAILVSTGVQTSRVLDAAEELETTGISAAVVHVPSIKPLHVSALLEALSGESPVFTIEEHSTIGGLGGLVSEIVTSSDLGKPVTRLGLADAWSESAPNDFLLDKHGLSSSRVAQQVRDSLVGSPSARS